MSDSCSELFLRVLASLNLPAALEDLSGDSIPQSIAEKARSIVQQGGLQSIEQLIRDLPELLTRNREILDEVRQQEHTEFHHITSHDPTPLLTASPTHEYAEKFSVVALLILDVLSVGLPCHNYQENTL